MRARVTFAIGVALLLAGSAAQAQSAISERDDLVQEITHDVEALSSADCTVACKAFASMQRAADRLCAIDAGPVCDDARAKVEESRRRIRASCPTCAVETPAPPRPAPPPEAQLASAPPSESKRGGCAGCSVGSTGGGDLGVAGIAVTLVAALLRGRRRRSA